MNKLCKLAAMIVMIAGLFLAWAVPAGADDDSPETTQIVRLGMAEYPGYAYKDDSGNVIGADVEYAYRIAQYANVKLQIVLIPGAEDYFGALDNGTVDMLFDAMKTPEREQKYLFANHEIGSTPMSVYVRPDDNRFDYGDAEALKGKVFASESGSEVGTLFINWSRQHGFSPEIRYYDNDDAMDAALNRGDVDACLYGTDTKENYRTIMLFSPKPYYIIFRRDEEQLKTKIDEAMAQISIEDPVYEDQLLKRYNVGADTEMTPFTKAEKEYIQNHGSVKVAVIMNDKPYFYMEDSTPKGVIPEYYQKLAELTGIVFEFKVFEKQADALAAVTNGEADVLGMFSDGTISAYNKGLRLTKAYTTVNLVLLSKQGSNAKENQIIAVKTRTASAVRNILGPNQGKIMPLPTAAECYEALKHDRVTAIVCGLPSATWIMNQQNGSAYNFSPLPSATVDLCGGVAFENATLCSILNKAIAISNYNFNAMVMSNTLPENNLSATISHLPAMDLFILTIALLVIILALIYTLYMLNKHHKERTAIMAEKAENDQQKIRLEAIAKTAKDRNQFFSNISHDMRTPLNAIIGFSTLAGQEAVSPKVNDYLNKIQSSGELLLDLINDTLTVSKLGSGKLQLKPEPNAIGEIFDTVAVAIQEGCNKKGLHFLVNRTQMTDKIVLVDRLNLQKIILNLLTNAVKYTPAGGSINYRARSHQIDERHIEVVIIVQDTGIGISSAFLPHIFEPFVQEQRAGYQGSGTGLGLSIVWQLVELMNGTIDVMSTTNKGSTFTVTLPFEIVDQEVRAMSPQADVDITHLQGKKLLLCEDNTLNQEIACEFLKQQGMTADVAENGEIGVRLFAESKIGEYAAILMDIRMPVMDGYEATKAIRALNRSDAATIPIIAMTADVFDDTIRKSESAGMNIHIGKPLEPQSFYAVLGKMIKE